jgi:hypothetical protein
MALVALVLFGAVQQSGSARANSPGSSIVPLIACSNLDGDPQNGVRVGDILEAVNGYFDDSPGPNYVFLRDTTADGLGRVDDILVVVGQYFTTCPLVDTQVAQATQWALANVPMTENEAALEAMDYYQASSDVPGQGVHYVNFENWDGVFDPAAPEGLVYHGGKLAAQLYVTDGTVVSWGTHAASSYPPPPVPHDVSLEVDADGPMCNPACSWDGTFDGWHMHYYLCTIHIGQSNAIAIPASFVPSVQTQSGCASLSGGEPECTVPITTTPCYRWAVNVGWMGHLWNWLANPNQVPDQGGDNGRFADCFPDTDGWKEFNCPG